MTTSQNPKKRYTSFLKAGLSHHQIFLMTLLDHPLMNRSKTSYPTLCLGPLLLPRMKILHKKFLLVTNLGKIHSNTFTWLSLLHCSLTTLHKPHTYRETFTDFLWQIAMKKELDALSKNHTWALVNPFPRKFVVGCKRIYKIKIRSDGSIEHYKTHLVAKCFT